MSHAMRSLDLVLPRIRVATLADLAFVPDGPTRGYAHIGSPDHPADAPGHLDLDPLLLLAVGELFPGEEVAMHRHENIENVMVMLEGAMLHHDSLGNRSVAGPDHAAVLSAGRGIEHAERVVGSERVRALVIWIRPAVSDGVPAFVARRFDRAQRHDRWQVLASGRHDVDDALPLACDAELRATMLDAGAIASHTITPGRRVYAISIDGTIEANGHAIEAGERLIAEGEGNLHIVAHTPTELILLDLP